jgi:hypothetical protein
MMAIAKIERTAVREMRLRIEARDYDPNVS